MKYEEGINLRWKKMDPFSESIPSLFVAIAIATGYREYEYCEYYVRNNMWKTRMNESMNE